MASAPYDEYFETHPTAPMKAKESGSERFESNADSPIHVDHQEESRDALSNDPSNHEPETRGNRREDQHQDGRADPDDEEERRQREEEESIALARALMAEEAMAVSYHMSVDYLLHNRDQFSEEDLAALQAAMEENEPDEEIEEDEDGGMSYDMMLRLGERLGDVKSERWSRIAQEKINKLPTFQFAPESVKDKDENDCTVKCLVCQFPYENKECLRQLPCGHCFHRDCIDQWLLSKDFCPYCRKPIIDVN